MTAAAARSLSPEDALVVGLCRGGAAGLPTLAGIRWDRVLATAARHRVAPAVLGNLAGCDLPADLRRELAAEERRVFVEDGLRKGALREVLAEVVAMLGAAGIEVILLKGFALDFDCRRSFRDLDLLVRERDLPAAIRILTRARYLYVGDRINRHLRRREVGDLGRQLAWNNQFQLRDPRHGALVELHTNLFERRRTHDLDLDPLLDQVELWFAHRRFDPRLGCHVLPPDLSLLAMALYAAIRYSPAVNNLRLQVLVDIDRIVRSGVDWSAVTALARQLRVVPYLVFSLTLVRDLLSTPVPGPVLDRLVADQDLRQRLASRLHLRCVRSLCLGAPLWSALYRAASPFLLGSRWSDRLKWLGLLPLLFPPRWRMAERFGLREGSPLVYLAYLVNPIRWLAGALRRGYPAGHGHRRTSHRTAARA